ncbi:MAG: hypothetical protein ACI81P_002624 [Neolewinella sp.]|jgi:hypothetical protein
MHINNTFSFLLPLVLLTFMSPFINAQMALNEVDSLPLPKASAVELDRIEQLLTLSPHYKNPNAAGRLVTLNRATLALPTSITKVRLSSPAYKNRKVTATSGGSRTNPAPKKPQLTGPRYKNRRAKAHRQ